MGHSGRVKAAAIGFLLAVAVTAAIPGLAQGDPTPAPPSNPSDGDIAAAGGQVDSRLGQVATLVNQVAAADQQMQRLDDDVAAKREAVNKALVDLQDARAEVARDRQRVDATKAGMATAAGDITRTRRGFDSYAAQLYMHGSELSGIAATLGSSDPDQLLDRSEVLDRLAGKQQAALDGLRQAQVEKANANSAARAAAAAAASAAADAEQKKNVAEQSVRNAEAVMAQQSARKQQLEDQRNSAQSQLDAARQNLAGLQGQRAAFIAWDDQQKAEQAARAKLLRAAKDAAIQALRRVASDAAARDRASALANGESPHTQLDGDGNQNMAPRQSQHSLVPPPTGSAAIETVIDRAMSQLGVSYAWGGGDENGPTLGIHDGGVADRYGDYKKIGFDCSGLMVYAFAGVGISLPHYSGYQYNAGTQVPLSQRKRGDMLFWGRGGSHHVALYLGNDMMIEAPESGEVVRVTSVRFDGIQPYAVRMIDA